MHSGRTEAEYRRVLNKGEEANAADLISDFQIQFNKRFLQELAGPGKFLDSFQVLLAWAIEALIDPANVGRWEDRVTAPLQWLIEQGYLPSVTQAAEQVCNCVC